MPHQCLQCGRAFEQGSMELLRGCPGCGGTRFFFSAQPLPEPQRQALKDQQSADVKNVIMQLLTENPDASAADVLKAKSWDEWVRVQKSAAPTPGPEAMVEARRGEDDDDADAPASETAAVDTSHADRFAAAVKEAAERAGGGRIGRSTPGTVNVAAPGEYELDVEALMARDPIVIEKDGTYMIHLPSAFDGNGKRGRRR